MSDSSEKAPRGESPSLHGLLAEYESPHQLIAASKAVRDAGYRRWDTFSPFPVHGIDPAMGIRPTLLPWIVFSAGLAGGTLALGFQWWTSTTDYPWIVSGKPMFSVAANIPITFELTVLFAAISCFVGMLMLNRLPRPAHPLDHSKRFARVTDDRFFVMIQADDPKFEASQTADLLEGTDPLGPVETIMEDDSSRRELPRGVIFALVILATAAVVPFSLAALARVSTSPKPRVHVVPDMDFQTKFKAQRPNPFFADRRAMRPQVAGTVAQGELREDDHFYRGKVGSEWARSFPSQVSLSEATMQRGREQFGVYCTPCHGSDGRGQGMVHLRAKQLMQGTWVPPTDLHQANLHYLPVGQLFDGISRGVRNMPGYARQISTADRWAVVLYLRALQRSRAATLADVAPKDRGGLK